MEDVLSLYEKPYDSKEPVLCFDEKSKELRDDARTPIPAKEGVLRKRDYEYVRRGTRNIFMTVEPKGGYRSVSVTKRRTTRDFAHEIKRIANLPRYAHAKTIRIILDNLNTHSEKSLVTTFGEEEAEKIMCRIVFHHTPKHASWLNAAEIELSVMNGQCTKGRIKDASLLKKKLVAWRKRRNADGAVIRWNFTVADAKRKFRLGTDLS